MHYLGNKSMKRYNKFNLPAVAAIAFVLLFLTASCGSSRNASRGGQTYRTEKNGQKSKKSGKAKKQDSTPRHIDFASVKLAPVAEQLLREADSWIGTPYRWGGNDRKGVDCSGFVTQVFHKSVGIKLPRTSRQQHDFCLRIDRDDLRPGDLVFFTVRGGSTVGHVGIYIGNDRIVHSSSSKGVIISSLSTNYYKVNYHSCGRVEKYFAMTSGNHQPKKPAAASAPAKKNTRPDSKPEKKADNDEKKHIQQVASARTSRIGKSPVEPTPAASQSETPTECEADDIYDFFD